jgi:aminoglycoside/choline kinase family phosphotransferase
MSKPMPPSPEERARQIDAFLGAHFWADARRESIGLAWSHRKYWRLTAPDGATAVLMDAPPGLEDTRPFVALDRHLAFHGFSVPGLIGVDVADGLLLLEDFGDDTFLHLLAHGLADEEGLYAAAVDVLAALRQAAPPAPATLPDGSTFAAPIFDAATFIAGPELVLDWYVPAVLGRAAPDGWRASFHAAWTAVEPLARGDIEVLMLRDYHVLNLMWLPEREGLSRVGLLDFQDASLGPAAYDLVSLLQDIRRDVPPALEAAMRARYAEAARAAGRFDGEAFDMAYAVLGAQRNARIAGLVFRKFHHEPRDYFLDFLPRIWRHLEADLAHPALAPVRDWFDTHLPGAELRGDWKRPR